jgi:hypothetical protein
VAGGRRRLASATRRRPRRLPGAHRAEDFLAGTASCRVLVDDVDGLYAELAAPASCIPPTGRPVDTDYGTREFATLDVDGNLITFYRRG